MDFIDRLGDFFNAITAVVERLIRGLFGSSNERDIRRIGFIRERDGSSKIVPGSVLDRINTLEPEMKKLSEGELRATTDRLKQKLAGGQKLEDVLPEAFAAVRESGVRYLQMRHYDVQLVGGYILNQGKIAEMMTGEGKTLVASLPAYLNALVGKVHVVTVNDYLAKRDMEWIGPLHMGLGLTMGAIQSQMRPDERQREYAADITYGTNNEFGFDYLRDNMKPNNQLQVQGPLDFAIVDEIDNILIDEARTPLIISGPAHDDITKYPRADRIARQLARETHFEVKEKEHTCHLTDDGVRKAEELAGVESFYTAGNMEWPHLIDNALKAHYLYKRDVNYVVENGEVVIVDEHTGRKMPGRQWSDGLHQAVEAKEGVRVKEVSQTLATITLQNYFKLYKKLCGMTGTAMTEANEFYKIYGLDVVAVPTNRPMQRINHHDVIYRSEREKWHAVVDEIAEVHKSGRPILVGTVSIEKSERLSSMLDKRGVKHSVLNAKYHEREAEIVAQAGRLNGVTIATNMAGRGTDIILGGNAEHMAWENLKNKYPSRLDVPKQEWDELANQIAQREGMKAEGRKVAELGGLHVVGTERHDSRRIDLQLRGRAGRQGDPGSSRFFLSLEDDLMRIFAGDKVKAMLTWLGMQEGESIEHGMVSRQIEKAQKRVEERHFESRKNLLEYDEVMDHQRKEVYGYRQRILDGGNCRELILTMLDKQVEKWALQFLQPQYQWETAAAFASQTLGIVVDWQDLRDMTKDQMAAYLGDEASRQAEGVIEEQLDENLSKGLDPREWNWQTLATWANRHFGINTNDRELRKIARGDAPEGEFDRDEVARFLQTKADEAIARFDFSPLDIILADDFGHKQLSGWLRHHFGVEMSPAEFDKFEDARQALPTIQQRVRERYHEREIRFPVVVGMNRYLAAGPQADRAGLVDWANHRFETDLTEDDLKEKERVQVADVLIDRSREFYPTAAAFEELQPALLEAFPLAGTTGDRQAMLTRFAGFMRSKFRIQLDVNELAKLTDDQARLYCLQRIDDLYRAELSQAERFLLLEMLDHAWKEHLYYMDHLRSGIGLVGYAQKDPKVEYKREGMKAFEQMWDRIAEQSTSAVFRLESESSPQFLDSLWSNASAQHVQARSAVEEYQETGPSDGSNGVEPGAPIKTIETIRNFDAKVGRNDLCPCGSGKKFKKCHGADK
ncbi:preprotein translocase subunit SecA [Planctomicrobium piriforme]|uniref:Protein translocase subunit SecA n=1 Tax=Planctomicrobium piriforme TaxID=1576369 RepID=A0A1I3AS34_9PLAN|nr:preprotein translocase subunit SecA [Planctomicrobium piriforme]SFH52918.1 preprotein translocase subunit SecA [Planctomicrobium piriforme]